MTPAGFLRRALDVEEKQYVPPHCHLYYCSHRVGRRILQSKYRAGTSNTVHQLESVHDQRTSLTRLIEELRHPQAVYMPGCAKFLEEIDPNKVVDTPESVKLWLPSALRDRGTLCVPGLPLLEYRLRYAQAVDSLEELRRLLRLTRALRFQSKKHITTSQKTAPPSRGVFEGMQAKITHVSARYRDAFTALHRLHPSGKWASYFQELKKEDVHGPAPEDDNLSNSRFIPSWIWTMRAPADPPDFPGSDQMTPASTNDGTSLPPSNDTVTCETVTMSQKDIEGYVMVDWAKAHERVKRFEEEVKLCTEEMRRVLAFFSWSAAEWERRAQLHDLAGKYPSDEVLQGLRAYALRHSAMFLNLIQVFASDWHSCLGPKGLSTEWLTQYICTTTNQKGWNRIPSIIPPAPIQPDEPLNQPDEMDVQPDKTDDQPDEPYDQPLAEIDEAFKQDEDGLAVVLDAETELHEHFVQIFVE